MKRSLVVLLTSIIAISACNNERNNPSAANQKFCGRWKRVDSVQYNMPYFNLKSDGSFYDMRMARLAMQDRFPQGVSWAIDSNRLSLKYEFHRKFFRLIDIPTQFHIIYKIKSVTDSLLILIQAASKHYPERLIALKRMNEHMREIIGSN